MVENGLSKIPQLVRSPGVYFNDKVDKNGKVGYGSTVIPKSWSLVSLKLTQKTSLTHASTAHVKFHLQRLCVLWILRRDEIIDILGIANCS